MGRLIRHSMNQLATTEWLFKILVGIQKHVFRNVFISDTFYICTLLQIEGLIAFTTTVIFENIYGHSGNTTLRLCVLTRMESSPHTLAISVQSPSPAIPECPVYVAWLMNGKIPILIYDPFEQ